MKVRHNHFLRHEKKMVERLVAQAPLLARHLFVILLERFEILELARFLHLDGCCAQRVLHLVGQEHDADDLPDASIRVALRVGLGKNHCGFTCTNRHEEVGEQDPTVVVAHLSVCEAGDVETRFRQNLPRGSLQDGSRSDPVGERQCPAVGAVAVDYFLEAWEDPHDRWKRLGQFTNPLDLPLRSEFVDVRDLERRTGHRVPIEQAVSTLLDHYFPNKAELVKAAFTAIAQVTLPRLEAAAERADGVRAKLLAVLDEGAAVLLENPHSVAFDRALRMENAEHLHLGEDSDVIFTSLHDVIAGIIDQAAREGILNTGTAGATDAIFTVLRGLHDHAATATPEQYRATHAAVRMLIQGSLFDYPRSDT